MSTKPKPQVLVADDEEDVLRLVASYFSAAGFAIVEARDGAEALQMARELSPALAVLDQMMPRMSGLEVLQALKKTPATALIPIVMLTARKSEIDRVLAFELGVDDYVTKPFSPRELTLRITRILDRQMAAPSEGRLSSGTLTLDRDRHEVKIDGTAVPVTATEYRLVLSLLQSGGRVLTREELIVKVWGDESPVDARTIDTHLRRLRAKLGPVAEQIQTVRGFGYRLSEDQF